jgi:uroporphyrinogen-III synthase
MPRNPLTPTLSPELRGRGRGSGVNPPPSSSLPRSAAPLAGCGVLVTRPARQAGAFAQKLAALGASPIVFPAIVILPPDDFAPLAAVHARIADFDVAVFVSANAVEYGAPDAAQWPKELVAIAPGPGTAEALAAVGIGPARYPTTTFDSESMLSLPELSDLHGRRIVVFRGEQGRELLSASLRQRGAHVETVACYRRAAPSSGAAGLVEALREGRVHALTFTSSEGVDNLWSVVGDEGRRLLVTLPAFVPHPRIARRAQDLGLHATLTAGGDAGLLAGLLRWAGEDAR